MTSLLPQASQVPGLQDHAMIVVALEPFLELALVDQAGLELTE